MLLKNHPYPAAPGQEEVDRVICASQAQDSSNVYATMEAIRDRALSHNPQVGIHTALLYQSGWFLHWAEGPRKSVAELFARVASDERHFAQNVVHSSKGRRLLITPFSMMMSPSPESTQDFGVRVKALWQQMHNGVQLSPTAVIRKLMMPMLLPEAQLLPDPDTFHRVAVCSAAGQAAFDMTAWLANQMLVPRAYRRLAGEIDQDSGSEYVEFMRGDLPCRVIAIARSGLLQGLHRSLAPDWDFLTLLFCNEDKRNALLLDRVRNAFAGLPRTPSLLAIAPDVHLLRQVELAAHTLGLSCAATGLADDHESAAIWQAILGQLDSAPPPTQSIWPVSDSGSAALIAESSRA